MSVKTNQELSSWKDVLVQLGRVETAWRGIPLSRMDHLTYIEALLMQALVLNDLSNRYEGLGSKRDHVNWAMRIASVDVGSLASFLSDAIVLWRRVSSPDVCSDVRDYAGFKHQLSEKYPFAGQFLAPMRGAIDFYFANPSPRLFYPVYQALSFLNHLTLEDIDMVDELEAEYVAQEETLAALHLHPFLIERMREVMTDWFKDFDMRSYEFIPQHGPGGVAELPGDRSIESKYRELAPDSIIRYVFKKYADLDAMSFCPLAPEGQTSRCSRIVFVPKSMKKKRVISAEPATLQYFQQGLDRILRIFIREHDYLSERIDLNDQTKQREAALKASRYRSHATVDLSAASDSIHIDLVKQVFRDTPLYPFLVALRSRTAILPSGTEVKLAKYAPMGSALTFPMQSLIFACILECTGDYVRSVDAPDLDVYDYRVYGDDIIVPDPCLTDLESNLRLLGFKVNYDKTYGGRFRFRESCGCDAYDGVDVSPLRIGRKFTARRATPQSPGVLAGLVDMANSAYVYEFPLLRRYLIDRMINREPVSPLFSSDPDFGVYSPQPTNFHLPERWCKSYQRVEYRAGAVGTCTPRSGTPKWLPGQKRYVPNSSDACPDNDAIRLFEWLRRAVLRTDSHPDAQSHRTRGDWKLSASFLPGNGVDAGLVDPMGTGPIVPDPDGLHIGNPKVYLARRWSTDWGFTSSVESEETIQGMSSYAQKS